MFVVVYFNFLQILIAQYAVSIFLSSTYLTGFFLYLYFCKIQKHFNTKKLVFSAKSIMLILHLYCMKLCNIKNVVLYIGRKASGHQTVEKRSKSTELFFKQNCKLSAILLIFVFQLCIFLQMEGIFTLYT